jgi:hypothetical protein
LGADNQRVKNVTSSGSCCGFTKFHRIDFYINEYVNV